MTRILCSFCAKGNDDVVCVIVSPVSEHTAICDECVTSAAEAVVAYGEGRLPRQPLVALQ